MAIAQVSECSLLLIHKKLLLQYEKLGTWRSHTRAPGAPSAAAARAAAATAPSLRCLLRMRAGLAGLQHKD